MDSALREEIVFTFARVSAGDAVDGAYCQVSFDNEPDAESGPYVLLQKDFEDDDGTYYFGTDNEELCGRWPVREVEIARGRLKFELLSRPIRRAVTISFSTPDSTYEKLVRILSQMLPDIQVT